MSGIWDGMSKLFICILIFICLGLAFIVLTSIPIVLDKVSDYKNRDYFVEKRGKDVNFAGYGSKGSSSADVKVDGIRYDFSITDRSKIDENLECYVFFNTKNEHVILISKGEKVDFKERMMRELRWYAKVIMLWVAALTFLFLYYRLVDKRITKNGRNQKNNITLKSR